MGADELGVEYKKVRAQLKREAPAICALCGKGIDLTLPRTDPMGWTADHIYPVSTHPELAYELSNLQPAHRLLFLQQQERKSRKKE